MKGVNELVINEETLVAALQYYLECEVFEENAMPTVKSVSPEKVGGEYSGVPSKWAFTVLLEEKQ